MRFSHVRSGADDKERILKTSLVQKGDFIKARRQDQRAELLWVCEVWLIYTWELGR